MRRYAIRGNIQMMRICVTGVGGYLGTVTALALIREGYEVVGTGSRAERPAHLPREVIYRPADIRDESALAEILSSQEITDVFHFAAIKYVGKCEQEPELCESINVGGTNALLHAMQRTGISHIVFASSYLAYDLSKDEVILTEESETHPQSMYGKSKLKSEMLIQKFFDEKKLPRFHTMRYGNVIGVSESAPHVRGSGVVDRLVEAARTGDTVDLYGTDYHTLDGTVAKDFIDVRDVAAANLRTLSSDVSGVYNIGSGTATTLHQIIETIERVSGAQISVRYKPRNGNEPSSVLLDSTRAKKELAWAPKYSCDQTLETLWKLPVT
jgi:UDP-glucose 4-epimerase